MQDQTTIQTLPAMQGEKKIKTLAGFCEVSNINPSLIRAVVRQMGGWESFTQSAADIANHGIDGGFNGFIYYSETHKFARANRKLISEMASEQADELGCGVFEMFRGFGCFRGETLSDEEIGSALYAGENDVADVLNAMAWYAGEEVAQNYNNLVNE